MSRRQFLLAGSLAIPALAFARQVQPITASAGWCVVGVGETGCRIVRSLQPELDAAGHGSLAVAWAPGAVANLPASRVLVLDAVDAGQSLVNPGYQKLSLSGLLRAAEAATGRFIELLDAHDRVVLVADFADPETTMVLPELVSVRATHSAYFYGRFAIPEFFQGGQRLRMHARRQLREIRVGLRESRWIECPEFSEDASLDEVFAAWDDRIVESVRELIGLNGSMLRAPEAGS